MIIEKHFLVSVLLIDKVSERLDKISSKIFPSVSRTKLQNIIKEGRLSVDGKIEKNSRVKIKNKQLIEFTHKIYNVLPSRDYAESIPIEVTYEDNHILVINKPHGMVVHPGINNNEGTLMNALLFHYPFLYSLPRAGILHRLDKDTSGLIMIAKNNESFLAFVEMIKNHKVKKIYHAIVKGKIPFGGSIESPIGRHEIIRTKQAIKNNGKYAITEYTVIEKFNSYTYVKIILITGRTHQIRVHFDSINHPLLGDQLYGTRNNPPGNNSNELKINLQLYKRQMLHAKSLEFIHPFQKKIIHISSPLPVDINDALIILRKYNKKQNN